MSSLSRTFARASRRSGEDLMKKYQPAGAYAAGEKQHQERLAKKRAEREAR